MSASSVSDKPWLADQQPSSISGVLQVNARRSDRSASEGTEGGDVTLRIPAAVPLTRGRHIDLRRATSAACP